MTNLINQDLVKELKKPKNIELVSNVIYSNLKISDNNICICGSLKQYINCCKYKPRLTINDDLLKLFKPIFEKKISGVPPSNFADLKNHPINSYHCYHSDCKERPIKSHLIPKNIIKAKIGEFPYVYKIKKDTTTGYEKVSYDSPHVKEKIFCETHDNNLFEKVDTLTNYAKLSSNQIEKLTYKVLCFALHNIRWNCYVALQAEAHKIIFENAKSPKTKHHLLQINEFYKSLLRGQKVLFQNYKKFKNRHRRGKEMEIYSIHLKLPSPHTFLTSTVVQPSTTPFNNKIQNYKSGLLYIVGTFEKKQSSILVSCRKEHKNIYTNIFEELKIADGKTQKNFINKQIQESYSKALIQNLSQKNNVFN